MVAITIGGEVERRSLRRPLWTDVLTAARERVAWVFDTFPRVYCSFSAGKDSTVLLDLATTEARRRGRRFGVLASMHPTWRSGSGPPLPAAAPA